MATTKISELTEVTSPIATDVFPIVNGGETKKVQLTNVKTVLGIDDVDTRLTTAESVIGNETDTYSASSTYALGDLVIYNSLLYKCTTAITVAEAWNSAKWTQVSLTSLAQSGDVYSTEEQVIGIWIDGKPLYRKVLSATSIATGSAVNVPTGIVNINKMLNAYGFGLSSNDNWFPLSRAHSSEFTYQSTFYYNKTNNRFEIETGSNVSYSEVYIIAEYTKTSD